MKAAQPLTAIVRPPGASFARALSAQQPRPEIDVALARQQHAEYCAALRAAGLELIELDPDDAHPDAPFVQDTAVVWGGLAVMARFGVPSREGEQDAVRRAIGALHAHRRLAQIDPPGTLEGGDVLVVGSRLIVGLSARTNRAGFARLRELLEIEGATVEAQAVPPDLPGRAGEGLHLLSGCTYLGSGVLLATERHAGLPALAGLACPPDLRSGQYDGVPDRHREVIRVPADEAYAANALGVNGCVVLPAGCPRTAALVAARGFRVLPVPLTEFAKADGGVTCLSLLL